MSEQDLIEQLVKKIKESGEQFWWNGFLLNSNQAKVAILEALLAERDENRKKIEEMK